MRTLAIVAYGRMAPVTIGHRKLVEVASERARVEGGDAFLYLSHSYDGRDAARPQRKPRNPLKYGDKVLYARDAFADLITVVESPHRSIFPILTELWEKGYTDLLIVGDAAFLDGPFEKYNGTLYQFETIRLLEPSKRDENSADVVEAVSATFVRETVRQGDYQTFSQLVATRTKTKALWHTLRNEMGLS